MSSDGGETAGSREVARSGAGARTQAERSEATRAALIGAARELFGARGYVDVGTEEVVKAAGVTRGALYHHFDGKRDLMRAVYEQVEAEFAGRVAESLAGGESPLEVVRTGAEMFLDAALEPEVQRIVLLDAPAVLGWEEWRAIGFNYGLGLLEGTLQAAMDAGEIRRQPVRPLAHALLGALDEVAMLVARADDPDAARAEAGETLVGLIESLRT
jgi:AcrR family transcriptional regulator